MMARVIYAVWHPILYVAALIPVTVAACGGTSTSGASIAGAAVPQTTVAHQVTLPSPTPGPALGALYRGGTETGGALGFAVKQGDASVVDVDVELDGLCEPGDAVPGRVAWGKSSPTAGFTLVLAPDISEPDVQKIKVTFDRYGGPVADGWLSQQGGGHRLRARVSGPFGVSELGFKVVLPFAIDGAFAGGGLASGTVQVDRLDITVEGNRQIVCRFPAVRWTARPEDAVR